MPLNKSDENQNLNPEDTTSKEEGDLFIDDTDAETSEKWAGHWEDDATTASSSEGGKNEVKNKKLSRNPSHSRLCQADHRGS